MDQHAADSEHQFPGCRRNFAATPHEVTLTVVRQLQAMITNQIDEITAEGKLPDLPSPDSIAKSIQKELRSIFLGEYEDLETPAYTVIERNEEFEIR